MGAGCQSDNFRIRWLDPRGVEHADTLFALFAALARGEAQILPGLRPHQREPFHAFAVQVAALALVRAGFPPMPQDETGWRDLLLGLTPDWPGGETWTLVVDDWTRPALLQPPIVRTADCDDYRSAVPTPDALDMLVTSRNHDVKAAAMEDAADEDWFFALLTLQTTEGFLGAGNYGISRMNGGFASRMTFGLRADGGLAGAWRRDVERLLDHAQARPGRRNGIALLWLQPWDGTLELDFTGLDELYVEICRRVRLRRTRDGRLAAAAAGSKVARVAAAALKGRTEDPWAPLKADGTSSITPTSSGFGYRQLTRLLDRKQTNLPQLALSSASDPAEGMALVAAALVRGQGKTEGLHRRTVPFSRSVYVALVGDTFLDRVGEVASLRTNDAGEASRLLRRALFGLVQGGPDKIRLDDKAADSKAAPWMKAFDTKVDREFFDETFWLEITHKATSPRRTWRTRLHKLASAQFGAAAVAAPRGADNWFPVRAKAENMLEGQFRKFVEDTADGA